MPSEPYLVYDAKEVTDMFNNMQNRLRRAVLRKALVEAMAVIRTEVENACPDDGTGALKASIRVRVSTSSDGLRGSSRLDFGDQNLIAARTEWGHVMVTHIDQGHKAVGVVPPHPFIWPAVDRALPKALEVYSATIESELIAREGL